jgi:type IV secretory pathway VirD2 relaxase
VRDDDVEPHLGRMRSDGQTYLHKVDVAATRLGRAVRASGRRFDGSRIGRGASLGRVLGSRDRTVGLRARRAIVKVRLVRLGGAGASAARAHLRYVQRDGVSPEGEPGRLYGKELDDADGRAFLERGAGDRHQFRFIVSLEDGAEYPDLKPFVRHFMAQVEADLKTDLDWVAVDHHNTGHPHTHVIVRGVDARGRDLVIAPEYIRHGLRERAVEQVARDLGPRTDLEIEARLRHDMDAERLTVVDRRLLRDQDAERVVHAEDPDPFQRTVRTGRLRKLAGMGLADDLGAGRWRLAADLEGTLRRMGERGDIVRTMQRALGARGRQGSAEHAIFGSGDGTPEPIVGRVAARGLADEHRDRHFLVIEGVDARAHYVAIGRADAVEPLADGAVVRVVARTAEPRDVDRTVAAVADANRGRYSVDLHLAHDATATQSFAETHVRRLEAIRRTTGGADREPDGSWRIAPDHLARAKHFEELQLRDRPVTVEVLSSMPVERLGRMNALTWLDRELAGSQPTATRDGGFGREVRSALAVRRQWLIEQELADGSTDGVRMRRDALTVLRRRELARVAGELERELGKPLADTSAGARIDGRLVRRVDLAADRYALVENAREFALVPWRPVLERQLGQVVNGVMRDSGVSWRFGRARTGPEIGA